MIKHIVVWKLLDNAEGKTREENVAIIKEKLEGLLGKIEGLLSLEIGVNVVEGGADLCLISTHTDLSAYKNYQKHPLHVEQSTYVRKCVELRMSCDFEA